MACGRFSTFNYGRTMDEPHSGTGNAGHSTRVMVPPKGTKLSRNQHDVAVVNERRAEAPQALRRLSRDLNGRRMPVSTPLVMVP